MIFHVMAPQLGISALWFVHVLYMCSYSHFLLIHPSTRTQSFLKAQTCVQRTKHQHSSVGRRTAFLMVLKQLLVHHSINRTGDCGQARRLNRFSVCGREMIWPTMKRESCVVHFSTGQLTSSRQLFTTVGHCWWCDQV